jgi:hypothetical protein
MRRWIVLLFAALALLGATDVLAWQILTARMRGAWAGFVASSRAEGWRIAAGEPRAEGFPFAARLRIAGVEIAHDTLPLPGGMSYGAEIVQVELKFTAPTHIVLRPTGAMHLRLGVGPDIDFTAQDLVLRAAFARSEADLAGLKLQATTPIGPITVGELHASLITPEPGNPPSGSLRLALDAIDLPPDSKATLIAARLDHAALDASLDNAILTVRSLALAWGQLSLTGQGKLQPDAQGQPSGEAKLHLSGALETIDTLTTAGQIAPRDAATAKTVLALLQRPGPDGKQAVELPLKLRDRLLSVGGFPVTRLPVLQLPIAAPQSPQ